jgi:alpha-beta hydrolase superfamily lysophospholipase
MQDNEFYIQTGSGIQVYGKSWVPDKNPGAVVAVLHGFGDHIGRYEDFAAYFTGHRIAVIGIDLPGHGRSSGKRGHIREFPVLLNHVQQLMLETRRRFIDMPIILYGHSMGGNIAFNYALRNPSKEIKGVIVSSPWIRPFGSSDKWKLFKNRMMGKLYPSFSLSFELDPMELSQDPSIGKFYLEDPVKHDKISIRLYRDLLTSSEWIIKNAQRMGYPVLIMHGNEDRITTWEASSDLADELHDKVELKIWEGMRHELHHENAKESVLNYQLSWIQKILAGPYPD